MNTKWACGEGNKVITKVTEGRREGLGSFHSHPQFCYPAPGVPSAVHPPDNAALRSAAGSILEKDNDKVEVRSRKNKNNDVRKENERK